MNKLLIVFGMALALAACGKRGRLETPHDSIYPRQYPAARNPIIEQEVVTPQAPDISIEVPVDTVTPTILEINEEIAE